MNMIFFSFSEFYFIVSFPFLVMGIGFFLWKIRISSVLNQNRTLLYDVREKWLRIRLQALLGDFRLFVEGDTAHLVKSLLVLCWIPLIWVISLKLQGDIFRWSDLYFLVLVLALMMFDARYYLLPDPVVYVLLWSGILLALFGESAVSVEDAVWGVIISYSIMFSVYLFGQLYYKREVLGRGDLKFSAAIGAWIGGDQVLLFLFLGALIGVLYTVLCAFILPFKGRREIPFGPSLGFSGIILYFITRLMASL